jgi:hypothetical protein
VKRAVRCHACGKGFGSLAALNTHRVGSGCELELLRGRLRELAAMLLDVDDREELNADDYRMLNAWLVDLLLEAPSPGTAIRPRSPARFEPATLTFDIRRAWGVDVCGK